MRHSIFYLTINPISVLIDEKYIMINISIPFMHSKKSAIPQSIYEWIFAMMLSMVNR